VRSTRDCAVGTLRLQRPDTAEEPVEFRQEGGAGLFKGGITRHDQDVDLWEIRTRATKRLASEALDAVAIDGAFRTTLRNGEPKARRTSGVVSEAQKKTAAAEATADSSQRCEVGGAA